MAGLFVLAPALVSCGAIGVATTAPNLQCPSGATSLGRAPNCSDALDHARVPIGIKASAPDTRARALQTSTLLKVSIKI